MTKLYRLDNTVGYSQSEMNQINAEWDVRVTELNLVEHTEQYDDLAHEFCDEIASRT